MEGIINALETTVRGEGFHGSLYEVADRIMQGPNA